MYVNRVCRAIQPLLLLNDTPIHRLGVCVCVVWLIDGSGMPLNVLQC